MIASRRLFCLGFAQFLSWGVTYYLIGVFGARIVADLKWPSELVFGGFSLALLVMGMTSPWIGGLIGRHGGAGLMSFGAAVNASGCVIIAFSYTETAYLIGWIALGVGMRLTLYDAAFAALARIAGPYSRKPMSQITLLGGLASSAFWPLGNLLADCFGWRYALLCYAAIALLAAPLTFMLPRGGAAAQVSLQGASDNSITISRASRILPATLYFTVITSTSFLNAGLSAHMISVLVGLGVGTAAAVNAASLRGIGQSAARLCEVGLGGRTDPILLNLIATALIPASLVLALSVSVGWQAAAAFAFCYGAGNGLLTITRGTLPLILFDHQTYGKVVGRLLAPGFVLSASSPLVYAVVASRYGASAVIWLSICLALMSTASALILFICRDRWRTEKLMP